MISKEFDLKLNVDKVDIISISQERLEEIMKWAKENFELAFVRGNDRIEFVIEIVGLEMIYIKAINEYQRVFNLYTHTGHKTAVLLEEYNRKDDVFELKPLWAHDVISKHKGGIAAIKYFCFIAKMVYAYTSCCQRQLLKQNTRTVYYFDEEVDA